MTKEQFKEARRLYTQIQTNIHILVDTALLNTIPDINENVRDRLNEDFRFWTQTTREQNE